MSLNDLTDAIDDCSVCMTVTRFHPTTRVDGHVTGPAKKESFEISGSIQPMSARELQILPEGMRNENTKKIYTDAVLRTAETSDCHKPDTIEYLGAKYQVQSIADWMDLGGFYKVVVTRLGR